MARLATVGVGVRPATVNEAPAASQTVLDRLGLRGGGRISRSSRLPAGASGFELGATGLDQLLE